MLCKYIKGRLGNQLFQYATIRSFQKQYFPDLPIALSFKKVEKKAKKEHFSTTDSLKDFNCEYITVNKFKLNIKQYIIVFMISLKLFIYKYIFKKDYANKRNKVEEKYKNILLKNNIIWKTIGYTKFDISLLNPKKNIYFYGYFESPNYFKNIKTILDEDLTPKKSLSNSNKELYEIINNTESVCVSIRRGDFVSNEKYRKEHFICDEQYFYKAIDIIKSKIKNPRFIIFSDDVKWVKENMNFPDNSLYETGNDPVWEKLRLMYSCKHYILSNSSFSWWSQFLSRNKDKVVVAPSRWNLKNDDKELYDDNWNLI